MKKIKEFVSNNDELLVELISKIITFIMILCVFGLLLGFTIANADSSCWRIDYLSKVGPNEKIIAYNDCTGKSVTLLVPTDKIIKNGQADEQVLKEMARKIIETTK